MRMYPFMAGLAADLRMRHRTVRRTGHSRLPDHLDGHAAAELGGAPRTRRPVLTECAANVGLALPGFLASRPGAAVDVCLGQPVVDPVEDVLFENSLAV